MWFIDTRLSIVLQSVTFLCTWCVRYEQMEFRQQWLWSSMDTSWEGCFVLSYGESINKKIIKPFIHESPFGIDQRILRLSWILSCEALFPLSYLSSFIHMLVDHETNGVSICAFCVVYYLSFRRRGNCWMFSYFPLCFYIDLFLTVMLDLLLISPAISSLMSCLKYDLLHYF